MKGVDFFMSERYVVELENNHHYIVVDTVTGHRFYVPAQTDSASLCGVLNGKEEALERQRHHIKELETTLKNKGIKVETNRQCRNCKHSLVEFLSEGDEAYCELFEFPVSLNDYCNRWDLSV